MIPLRHPLLLASASPRRQEILHQIGIDHQVLKVPAPAGEDEPILAGETPLDYVQRTARDKAIRARAWLQSLADAPADAAVLTADTTVALDGDILGKPVDAAHAAQTLQRLSGRTHQVLTAVVLTHGDRLWEALSVSQVTFLPLSEAQIAAYCAGGEAMGKAGAYAIQGQAAVFVQDMQGSHSGIMGLPASTTYLLLQQAGLLA